MNKKHNFVTPKRSFFEGSFFGHEKDLMKRIVLLFLGGLLIACSSEDDVTSPDDSSIGTAVNFDRATMLAHWADAIIQPGYADFLSQLQNLETRAVQFTETPSEDKLVSLQSQWEEAYTVWQKISMFEIGPAEAVNYRLNINIYPSNTDLILRNIQEGSYNLNLSSNRVAKGFPALDYLLFGLAETNKETVAVFSGDQGSAYSVYLMALIADMKALTETVKRGWESGYRDTFVANDGSSATASVDRFVNDFIFYYEKYLRAGKMGIPAGVFSGAVMTQNLEALYHGNYSKHLFLTGLIAVQDLFNGKGYGDAPDGESLAAYITALNAVKDGADLSLLINSQFDEAKSMVAILESFKEELLQQPPLEFLKAYDAVQRSVPLLKVDMVSAMSITIDFVDADGD